MKNLKSKFKGWVGEIAMNVTAKVALPNSRYVKFHNVTLPTARGTTQIDHLIVSRNGIFVVETKMMKGWIYGSQYDKQWTQKFPNSSFMFQNPLRQNFGHIKALQEILPDLADDVFQSVICMCGEHKIKTKMPKNVTRGVWYVKFIRSFKEKKLTAEQLSKVISSIENKRLPATRETHKQHVAFVKKLKSKDSNE